jgi:hypothetical protein
MGIDPERVQLLDIVRRIRAADDEGSAVNGLAEVIDKLRNRGYSSGLIEGVSGGASSSLSLGESRDVAWAAHQRALTQAEEAIRGMETAGAPPDTIAYARIILEGLRTAQLTLMGLASGTLVPVRIKPGDTLDCLKVDPGSV